MTVYSVWRDLIKPTIFTYIIACVILAEIAGTYYLYINYPIMLDYFTAQLQYTTQTQQTPRVFFNDMKHNSQDLMNKLHSLLPVGVGDC